MFDQVSIAPEPVSTTLQEYAVPDEDFAAGVPGEWVRMRLRRCRRFIWLVIGVLTIISVLRKQASACSYVHVLMHAQVQSPSLSPYSVSRVFRNYPSARILSREQSNPGCRKSTKWLRLLGSATHTGAQSVDAAGGQSSSETLQSKCHT